PTFTHVPPSRAGSNRTTFAPYSAARCAVASPPLPPPRTIRSNDFTAGPLSRRGALSLARSAPGTGKSNGTAHATGPDAPPAVRSGTRLCIMAGRPPRRTTRTRRRGRFAMTASADPITDNPLLAETGLPRFDRIRPEHVEPALRSTLDAQRAAIAEAERVERPDIEWLARLERIHDEVRRVWGPVSHLNAVVSTPPLRDAYNAGLALVTELNTEVGQNEALYARVLELERTLPAERRVERELVAQALRDFRLSGVALKGRDRERFREIMQRLAALQAKFEQNLMDATDAFEHHETRPDALAGLPEQVLSRARAKAAEKGVEGYVLTLDPPTYLAVMNHARSAALRERYYEAWVTRASDRGPSAGKWDNGP